MQLLGGVRKGAEDSETLGCHEGENEASDGRHCDGRITSVRQMNVSADGCLCC